MNKQLKVGMGIGCGTLVVLFLLVFGSVTYWATNTGRDFKSVIKVEKKLNTQYGVLGAYVPVGAGLPSAERIETFLTIRKSMVEYHAGMEIALETYIAHQEALSGGGFINGIKSVRAGSQLGPAYALFWLARNEMLFEHGMGAGEYAYIYCLAYYGFLGFDPGDGVTGLDGLSSSDSIAMVQVTISDPEQNLTASEKARLRTSEMVVGFLERIEFPLGDDLTPELVVWQQEARSEIAALKGDYLQIPFQFHGRDALARLFESHRADLENVYTSRVNPLELFFQQEVEKKQEKEEE